MHLNGNFTFNKCYTCNNIHMNKRIEKSSDIYLNYNINKKEYGLYNFNSYNNTTAKNNIETNDNSSDISFYNTSLKNQILSPGDEDDIYQYNNKNKEIIQKNNDDIDYNYTLKNNINNKNYLYENSNLNNGNKKALILDLDETLIHSSFQPLQFNKQLIKPDIYFKIFFNCKYHEIFVYKRPFLNKFLKEMNKIFNIYVFTASIEKYAKPLLDRLDKHNYIIKKFYRESCAFSEGKFIKDLKALNINLHDIIILDNNPISYKFNKKNGIPIKSFHYDKNDKELLKIIPLLNFLSKVDDVRKYIPYIIDNDEINYNKINTLINTSSRNKKSLSLNKKNIFDKLIKQNNKIIRLNKRINYNTNEDIKTNILNNIHYPETINFREPLTNKIPKIPNNSNYNKDVMNNYSILNYKNDIYKKNINKNKGKSNSITVINFNLDVNDISINSKEKQNNIKNKSNDKYNKSCNNFYLNNNKYSFVSNQEKKTKQHLNNKLHSLNLYDGLINNNQIDESNNIINRYKSNKSRTKKIPFSRKNEYKINLNKKINNTEDALNIIINNKKNCKFKNYLNRFNSCKNMSSKFQKYESCENDFNTITPLIKFNDEYTQLRKNNTIEALGKNNNSIRNIICYNSINCMNTLNNNNKTIGNTINYDKKDINAKYISNCINSKYLSNNLKNINKKRKNKNILSLINNENKIMTNKNIHRLLTDRINKYHNLNDNDLFSNYSLKKEVINIEKNCFIKRKMKLKKSLLNNKKIIKENEKSEYEDYSNMKKYTASSERNTIKNIYF